MEGHPRLSCEEEEVMAKLEACRGKLNSHLKDSETYTYEALSKDTIFLYTCSAESVSITRKDLQNMLQLLDERKK